MGHSGEGRLLSGHVPAVVCGDGTACRSKDNPGVSGSYWASPVTAFLSAWQRPERFSGDVTLEDDRVPLLTGHLD